MFFAFNALPDTNHSNLALSEAPREGGGLKAPRGLKSVKRNFSKS